MSDRHLANHFQYATNSPPLNATVEDRIKTQFGWFEKLCYIYTLFGLIGLLEAFLMDQCKTVEFRDQMEAVKNACEVDHSGSTTLKNVYLLVCTSRVKTYFSFSFSRDLPAYILMGGLGLNLST